jgi:hypothetical protein
MYSPLAGQSIGKGGCGFRSWNIEEPWSNTITDTFNVCGEFYEEAVFIRFGTF